MAAVGDVDRCGYAAPPTESRHLDGDNPAASCNLIRPPLFVVLDLPVVAPDHTEQISHGPLTLKDRIAIPPISVRSVSTWRIRPAPAGHRSKEDWQPAQSGLITGGGADLLYDGRRARPAILILLPLTSRPVSVEGRRMPKKLTPSVSRLRRSRTRSRAGKATVRPASSPVRCCSASAATAARVR